MKIVQEDNRGWTTHCRFDDDFGVIYHVVVVDVTPIENSNVSVQTIILAIVGLSNKMHKDHEDFEKGKEGQKV